jgi:hypothetical protein
MYSGTDYGIITMSTTVKMSTKRLQAHLALSGYTSPDLTTQPSLSSDVMNLVTPIKESCYRVTAGELSQRSLAHAFARKREKRKVRISYEIDNTITYIHELIEILGRGTSCKSGRRSPHANVCRHGS